MFLAFALAALATPAAACELAVFTAPRPAAVPKSTMFVRVAPPSDDPLAWGNVGNPNVQLNDLSDSEIREGLGLAADYAVSRHADRVITHDLRKAATPLRQPASPCYAELIPYEGVSMPAARNRNGKDEVWVRFVYREFDATGRQSFRFDRSGHAVMKALKKTAKTDRAAALADLKTGWRELIADFGQKLVKKRSRRTAA
jgi:hypothetical protein